MTPVYILVNQYQIIESDGDNLEIVGVFLDKSKADDALDEISEKMRGHWSDNHSVYNAVNSNMEYDSYYLESYEAE